MDIEFGHQISEISIYPVVDTDLYEEKLPTTLNISVILITVNPFSSHNRLIKHHSNDVGMSRNKLIRRSFYYLAVHVSCPDNKTTPSV